MAYQLDGRPLGKWQRQLKKRRGGEGGADWLEGVYKGGVDLVLFLKGSTGGENTRAGKKRKATVHSCCSRLVSLTER